jgi:hypothetical protein
MRLPLVLLTPFLGLLPANAQRRLEWRYGISSSLATWLSALLLMLISSVGFVSSVIALFVGSLGFADSSTLPWPFHRPLVRLVATYLFVESAVRLQVCLAQDQPIGSLPVVVAHRLAREIRVRLHTKAPGHRAR